MRTVDTKAEDNMSAVISSHSRTYLPHRERESGAATGAGPTARMAIGRPPPHRWEVGFKR